MYLSKDKNIQDLFLRHRYLVANCSLTKYMGSVGLSSPLPGCSEIHLLFNGNRRAELLGFSLSLPGPYTIAKTDAVPNI